MEQILYTEYKKMPQGNPDVKNLLLYQIISLHEAYHKIKPQLYQLKQITTIAKDLSARLHEYFRIKEINMVNLCLVLNMCS